MTQGVVSVNAAARAVGMTAQGLTRWVDGGVIPVVGRGPRRARLVQLAAVQAEKQRRSSSVSLGEAARMLHVETRTVGEMCASGALPWLQPAGRGGDVYIDREAVESLTAAREERAGRFLTTAAAIELTGWPHWVIEKLADEGRLTRHAGSRGALLIDKDELSRLEAEFVASPDVCPVCGEKVAPGRRFHKGRCAGSHAGRVFVERRPEIIERKRAELERLKTERHLRTVEDVAREFHRAGRIIWKHVWNHELGRIYPGPGSRVLLLNEADVGIIKEHLSGWHDKPKWRGDWYHAKFGSPAEYGRQAAALAERKANPKKVGAPTLLSDWQEDRVVDRLINRESYRAIEAAEDGVTKRQVERIAHAHGLADRAERPRSGPRPSLSSEQRARVQVLWREGKSQNTIARLLGISRDQVRGALPRPT